MARRSTLAGLASAVSLLLAPLAYADPGGGPVHVVQAGETLSQIASSAGVDAAAMATLNGLDDLNLLSVGQSLKLPTRSVAASASPPVTPASGSVPVSAPGSTASAASAAPAAGSSGAASASPGYTVADGDTLWSIAQQLNTTTAALVNANKLADADHVVVGAQLLVPAASGAGQAASAAGPVASGAGLAASAAAAPVPVATPAAPRPQPRAPTLGHEHVVAPGETLRDIAALEKIDLGSLIDFNQIDDPELIRVGQVVRVPAAPNQRAASADVPASNATPSAPSPPAPGSSSNAAPAGPPPPAQPAPAAAPGPAATGPAAPASDPARSAAASGSSSKPTPNSTTALKPKPAAPLAVVAPPVGSPTDGLAGAALKILGAPYVWGGSSPSGFDCSGFVWYVARQAGKPISRGMQGEYSSGAHPGRDELKPGDLVFFQNTYSDGLSHDGIFIGNGQFIHAANEAAGVTISSLGSAYWSSHWFGATRLP